MFNFIYYMIYMDLYTWIWMRKLKAIFQLLNFIFLIYGKLQIIINLEEEDWRS